MCVLKPPAIITNKELYTQQYTSHILLIDHTSVIINFITAVVTSKMFDEQLTGSREVAKIKQSTFGDMISETSSFSVKCSCKITFEQQSANKMTQNVCDKVRQQKK